MENELGIKKTIEDNDFFVFYSKSKELKFLILLMIFFCFVDFFSTIIGIVLFIALLFLSALTAKKKTSSDRLIVNLLFIGLVVFMGDFFLKPDMSFSSVTFSVVVFSTISFLPIIFAKKDSIIESVKRGTEEVSGMDELIGLCLRSESFVLKLILSFWLFFFAVAFQKMLIMSDELSGDLPFGGLVILFVYLATSIISFSLILSGMILSTKNVNKSFFLMVIFALMIIIALSIIYLPTIFLAPAYLTPSFGT
ncbi:MAG: hypothetical protein WCQ96_02505 [Patescibacteria group bacterium]